MLSSALHKILYIFVVLSAWLSFIDGQTAGPIWPKIGRETPGDLGSNIGGSNFLWGCPKGVPILCPKVKNGQKRVKMASDQKVA